MTDLTEDDGNPAIPSQRRQPKDHLKAAAKSTLGSNVEYYSVQAAIAEALVQIVEELHQIRVHLTTPKEG